MKFRNSIKSTVQRQFGRTAEKYVTSESHAKGDDLSLLIEWLSPNINWITLDVATGGGHVAKVLSPQVQTVFASDLTKGMLEAARTYLNDEGCRNINYILADAESLPFLDNTFDAVTCRIAPHHFPDPEQFVHEAWRVLKRGGSFLLIDNVAPDNAELAEYMNTFERMRDESHVRCPAIKEWELWLNASGFQIDKSRGRRKEYQFHSWVRRMVQSVEQVDDVEKYILSAHSSIQDYFNVQVKEGHIQSLQVDEWMVLCKA